MVRMHPQNAVRKHANAPLFRSPSPPDPHPTSCSSNRDAIGNFGLDVMDRLLDTEYQAPLLQPRPRYSSLGLRAKSVSISLQASFATRERLPAPKGLAAQVAVDPHLYACEPCALHSECHHSRTELAHHPREKRSNRALR